MYRSQCVCVCSAVWIFPPSCCLHEPASDSASLSPSSLSSSRWMLQLSSPSNHLTNQPTSQPIHHGHNMEYNTKCRHYVSHHILCMNTPLLYSIYSFTPDTIVRDTVRINACAKNFCEFNWTDIYTYCWCWQHLRLCTFKSHRK